MNNDGYRNNGWEKRSEKPYYYMRNGLLHRKRVVDEAVHLSESEVASVKEEFAHCPYAKQEILEKQWQLQVELNGKEPFDGLAEVDRRMCDFRRRRGNG